MPRLSSSTQRRHRLADKILCLGTIAMRPCVLCTRLGVLCVTSTAHESCEQCLRSTRRCDLASPLAEVERIFKKTEKLQAEALEAEAKAHRLRKQRRTLLKKIRELGAREERNIEKLKMDEATAEALKPSTEEQPQMALSPTRLS
jgi:uncharacterized protein YlxW (UPF0749 family)